MQEPLAVVDAVAVVAIDPRDLALRVFRDEVIAADVTAIPPAGFDPFGAVPQFPRRYPRLCLEQVRERLRLREQP